MDLHSIMYLLIPSFKFMLDLKLTLFTFHNVSINSDELGLHDEVELIFTFHNVSINSYKKTDNSPSKIHLHSIMYLLILS